MASSRNVRSSQRMRTAMPAAPRHAPKAAMPKAMVARAMRTGSGKGGCTGGAEVKKLVGDEVSR